MKIKIEQLEAVWHSLISNLKSNEITEIEVNESYYWQIDDEDLYNVYKDPKELSITIGDLTDEWPCLLNMASEPDDAIIHAFRWFSEILRAVSIKQPE